MFHHSVPALGGTLSCDVLEYDVIPSLLVEVAKHRRNYPSPLMDDRKGLRVGVGGLAVALDLFICMMGKAFGQPVDGRFHLNYQQIDVA